MLTRLKVSGFKNLVDTEVRFGPFTCIAGFNGVGKSNLFDAIRFLSLLADHSFAEAARELRGGTDFRDLFTAGGDGVMSFECDMIIPRTGRDEFGRRAETRHVAVQYALVLRLVSADRGSVRMRLLQEELNSRSLDDSPAGWLKEAFRTWNERVGQEKSEFTAFIKTVFRGLHGPEWTDDELRSSIFLVSEKSANRTEENEGAWGVEYETHMLPRTVLSSAQSARENPTAVLTRAEMRSWRLIQFEPSALRQPDSLDAPSNMDLQGHHLPATLARLADGDDGQTYARIANRLAEVVESVREVRVDRDDVRRTLQLQLVDRAGAVLPASLLSDGTLRFIALSALELDPELTGVVCLEEPENGLHPQRVSAMLDLLKAMAVDTSVPVGPDNPLRQVIISTHSPVVVAQLHPDDVIFADHRDAPSLKPGRLRALTLRPMAGTWRAASTDTGAVSIGHVLSYLGAMRPPEQNDEEGEEHTSTMYSLAEAATQLGTRKP